MNSNDRVTTLIINYIEKCTGYAPSDRDMHKKLDSFGLTSVQGLLLASKLEDELNIDLPHDMLLGNDTLSAYIAKIRELRQGV